jgi:hypothetical protein
MQTPLPDSDLIFLVVGHRRSRVLAGWEEHLSPETRLLRCDINPFLVNFCQKNLSHAEILQFCYYPPLPFRDRFLRRLFIGFELVRIFSGLLFFWTLGYFNFQKIVITNGGTIPNIRVRRCHRPPNSSLCAAAFGDATTAILLKLLLAVGRTGLLI